MQRIIRAVVRIALGMQDRLYIEDLSFNLKGENNKLKLKHELIDGSLDASRFEISVREFVRLSFSEIGIEIEFCGKGELEKGVIIDVDEERLEQLKIDKDHIKFGQTVVKCTEVFNDSNEEELLIENAIRTQNILHWMSEYNLTALIEKMILKNLEILKN